MPWDNAVTAAGQYEGKRFIEVATEKKHDMLDYGRLAFDGILFQENGKILSKKRQNKHGRNLYSFHEKNPGGKHGGASHFEAVWATGSRPFYIEKQRLKIKKWLKLI